MALLWQHRVLYWFYTLLNTPMYRYRVWLSHFYFLGPLAVRSVVLRCRVRSCGAVVLKQGQLVKFPTRNEKKRPWSSALQAWQP